MKMIQPKFNDNKEVLFDIDWAIAIAPDESILFPLWWNEIK